MYPKVSVIVPVYNTEKYLGECLESIINQTLKEIEIIIINDASPDNSIGIIRKYEQQDSRIILIDKSKNEGVGKARNDGINKATGEFVCFIDSDDLYSSETVLEELYEAAKKYDVKVSCGLKENLNSEGLVEPLGNSLEEYNLSFYQSGFTKYSDFQYDYGYQCYLFDRKMLIDNRIFFPPYSRFQDPPFFVKAMHTAQEYFCIDKPVYRYRLLMDSSKYTMKKTIDLLKGIMDNMLYSRENGLAKLYCLTVFRLNTEGSFMAIKNLFNEENEVLLAKLIEVNQAVDTIWLKENGFSLPEPFVLDVFKYSVDTAQKYESIRKFKIVKLLAWLKKKR